MRKIIVLLLAIIFLVSACSQQKAENPADLVGKGSDVQRQTQQAGQTSAGNAVASQAEVKEFKITAKQFAFTPDTIEVNKGDKVRLIVTSLDVPHGIAIKEYDINERLEVGKPTTIEFTADKQGTFTTYCSVFCGAGHSNMKGKIIVH